MKAAYGSVVPSSVWVLVAVFLAVAPGCRESSVVDTVQITSDPAGAMVFVDNRYMGVTPCTVKALSPGAHSLKMQKIGYKNHIAILDPAEVGGRLRVALTWLPNGKIVVTARPSDSQVPTESRVFVDGRYVGDAPVTVSNLAQREYQVRVIAEDYEACLENVLVKDATPVQVPAVLECKTEKYFLSAIASAPEELFNYTELARHYMVKKNFDGAIEMYKKAMTLANGPNAANFNADRNGEQRLLSDLAKAYVGWFADTDEEDLKKVRPKILALFSNQGDITAFFRQVRSWDHQAKGNEFVRPDKPNAETIKALEAAIQNDPKNTEMRLALGQLYTGERDYNKARDTYEAILKTNPKNFAAHRQLSDLYRRMGRYDDAQRELELAADCCDDPTWKPELHEKLASAFQARQKLPESVEQWKKAISCTQDPEDACRRRLRLALLYQKMGEKDDALKLYQQIVDTSKNPGLRNYAQYFLKRAQR